MIRLVKSTVALALSLQPTLFGQEPNLVSRVRVPATANPYLAGMPNGAKARFGDTAPAESPVLVELPPGGASVSFAAEGRVAHGPLSQHSHDGPDGGEPTRHEDGAENGISGIQAPFNSLVGVFLTDARPDGTRAPRELKVRRGGRDDVNTAPELKQVFFIGSGKTRAGAPRRILIPQGATRLFLGVMDGYEWNNNDGEFRVVITLERTDVSSKLTFADWACLPQRSQCTPGEAVVRELGAGRFRIVLPAHLEWGASVATPPGASVTVVGAKGTVCLDGEAGKVRCNGPEGDARRAEADVLVKGRPVGALVTRSGGGRTYFSVNGRAGPAFLKHEGFFEFEVAVQ